MMMVATRLHSFWNESSPGFLALSGFSVSGNSLNIVRGLRYFPGVFHKCPPVSELSTGDSICSSGVSVSALQ